MRLNAAGGLDLFRNQSSGVLTSTVWADGLVDNPPGQVIRARRHGALPAAGEPARALMAMKVKVRYFASLREALGSNESVELPAGASVGTLRDALLQRRRAPCRVAGARQRAVRCALDQVMADEDAPLHDGAEVAFFPPVTGG